MTNTINPRYGQGYNGRARFPAAALPFFFLVLVSAGSMGSITGATVPRPNIIFILVDDLRWDGIGYNGNRHIRTPGIDRIAEEGISFNYAYTTTPLCSPSRAGFFTGLHTSTHRIFNNDTHGIDIISHRLITFPQFLRKSGYETAFIGKWHMGFDDTRRPGFDEWISFKGQGRYRDPVVNENGRRLQLSEYMTDYLNRKAVEFVEKKRKRPFLLCVSHKAVHIPFLPAERHEKLYSGYKYEEPPSAKDDLKDQPVPYARKKKRPLDYFNLDKARFSFIERLDSLPEPPEPRWGRAKSHDSHVRDQMRSLASVDEGIGMIFDSLNKKKILKDTLIIFSSDNGFLLGEHGEFNKKRAAFEESIKIPLVMRYPRLIRPGTRRDGIVLNIDIAPTLLEIAGLKVPGLIQGKSLKPLFQAKPPRSWRTSFFAEYFMEKPSTRSPSWRMIRDGQWKYIHYPNLKNADELYNLGDDPLEMENLILKTEDSVIKALKKKLDRTYKNIFRKRPTAF